MNPRERVVLTGIGPVGTSKTNSRRSLLDGAIGCGRGRGERPVDRYRVDPQPRSITVFPNPIAVSASCRTWPAKSSMLAAPSNPMAFGGHTVSPAFLRHS